MTLSDDLDLQGQGLTEFSSLVVTEDVSHVVDFLAVSSGVLGDDQGQLEGVGLLCTNFLVDHLVAGGVQKGLCLRLLASQADRVACLPGEVGVVEDLDFDGLSLTGGQLNDSLRLGLESAAHLLPDSLVLPSSAGAVLSLEILLLLEPLLGGLVTESFHEGMNHVLYRGLIHVIPVLRVHLLQEFLDHLEERSGSWLAVLLALTGGVLGASASESLHVAI